MIMKTAAPSRRYLLYPIGLLLFLLLVDKLAFIPGLREAGRVDAAPNEVRQAVLRQSCDELALLRKNEPERKVVFVFGSSRSDPFYFTGPEEIQASPYLSASEKLRMSEYYFDARAQVDGGDLLMQLALLNTLIQTQDCRPDVIFLEVSPFMFSTALNRERWYEYVSDRDLIRQGLAYLPGELRWDGLAQLLFESYRLQWKPEKAVANIVGNRHAKSAAEEAALLAMFTPVHRRLPPDYVDYPPRAEGIPADVYAVQFEKYARLNVVLSVYRDFEANPAYRALFRLMMIVSRERDLPILLWTPKVHPTFVELVQDHYDFERTYWPEHYALIEAAGFPHFDARRRELRCERFFDSSHLGNQCGLPLAYEMIDFYEQSRQSRQSP